MADTVLRNRVPSPKGGLRQPSARTTMDAPTYPEAKGESSNMWSKDQPKKGPNAVRG